VGTTRRARPMFRTIGTFYPISGHLRFIQKCVNYQDLKTLTKPPISYNSMTTIMTAQNRPRQSDGRVHGSSSAAADRRPLALASSQQIGHRPLKVCFPGGQGSRRKTTHRRIREMQEELGRTITPPNGSGAGCPQTMTSAAGPPNAPPAP